MLMNLYVIYDKVSKEAGPVFSSKNDAVAHRSYNQILQSKELAADDFALYQLGVIDTEAPFITGIEPFVVDFANIDVVDISRDAGI
nr:MAG: nonstructural protein [Microviridae sp.]